MSNLQDFGRFTIHWRPPELRHDSRVIKLTGKQFEVLSLLVKARGKVVTKKRFHEKVWGGQFVEEGNLSQTVFLLRRTLGKPPIGLQYIETVPGEGYRIPAVLFQDSLQVSEVGNPSAFTDFSAGALQDETEHLRLLIDSIEDYAIYMLDCAGRILTWNRGAKRNKGYSREEVLGRHYSMLFVPEDIEARVPDRALAAAAKSGRCSGEGWRIRKNGERFWASYLITAIRNSNRKLVGYAKVVRDLTEHKQQEDALRRMDASLRRERDRLHAAAESSLDAFYICEAVRAQDNEIEDFAFTYLNSNVEKMVNLPRSAMLGRNMCELLPANRTLGLFDAYKRVVTTGEPYVAELAIQAENVRSEWIRLQAVRLDDGVAITVSDISERKRAEVRLQQLLLTARIDP